MAGRPCSNSADLMVWCTPRTVSSCTGAPRGSRALAAARFAAAGDCRAHTSGVASSCRRARPASGGLGSPAMLLRCPTTSRWLEMVSSGASGPTATAKTCSKKNLSAATCALASTEWRSKRLSKTLTLSMTWTTENRQRSSASHQRAQCSCCRSTVRESSNGMAGHARARFTTPVHRLSAGSRSNASGPAGSSSYTPISTESQRGPERRPQPNRRRTANKDCSSRGRYASKLPRTPNSESIWATAAPSAWSRIGSSAGPKIAESSHRRQQ